MVPDSSPHADPLAHNVARPANHLAGQSSPYLLQHLHNPVDWYPWGEAAFRRARAENKPIFLSIGYATCHWCHVMERECFENEAIAAQLNAGFVCVKVDREERPDVDRLHMAFLQASTGHGGWPLSVWLTPELEPFFAGSYFPPEDRMGRPGLPTVLERIASVWATEPERVRAHARDVVGGLAQVAASRSADPLRTEEWRAAAVRQLAEAFDEENGGFGRAPKFPNTGLLELLFDYQASGADAGLRQAARAMALTTLRKIVESSLRDHVGGGFHRYAVDHLWRLPHFEKMLYDQAQLVGACVTAWLLSGDGGFRQAAEECLGYLATRMREPAGGLHSAEDADSPDPAASGASVEGAFYVWTETELREALGAREAELLAYAYGMSAAGNLGGEVHGEFAGKNLPYQALPPPEVAAKFGLAVAEVETVLAAALRRLRAARERRPAPARDDKIVCAWNGLALSAFARAAGHFGERRWAQEAVRLAECLRESLYDPATRRLARSWRAGRVGPGGFAEDYSCLIQGLLDLCECVPESRWLEWALELQQTQDELFRDAAGGYFASEGGAPDLVVRMKDDHDGAEPAASSLAVRNKARLAALLHRPDLRASAEADARSFAATVAERPLALPHLLAALGWLGAATREVVIVGRAGEAATEAMVAEVRRRHLPRTTLLVLGGENRAFFERQSEFFRQLPPAQPGRAVAYVCRDGACQLPVATVAELGALLDGAN